MALGPAAIAFGDLVFGDLVFGNRCKEACGGPALLVCVFQ
jgi:hypothetical protein